MKQTRLILVGGFLGAGKTTLLWETAVRLMNKGLRVGLITNDQAPELVDSELLKLSDLRVAEVSGSCFCCNFNGFTDAIKVIRAEASADVIIAEPVGSCADLSATIMQPLKQYWNAELKISPLTVLADPNRLVSILNEGNGGVHPDAAYAVKFDEAGCAVGHVKVIAENGKRFAVGNLTGKQDTLSLRGSAGAGEDLKLIINARVETTPELLDQMVREVLIGMIDGKYEEEVVAWRFLQPGRPNPTHRFVEIVKS